MLCVGIERVAMGIRLNLEYDRDFFEKDEREWRTFVWHENKCGWTKLNEADSECHAELREDSVVLFTFFN